MLGPRVGPEREFVCECYRNCSRSAIPRGGIAQGVLHWFQYYVRCLKYKVLMKMSAAFYYQNGKTIAYLNHRVCIC